MKWVPPARDLTEEQRLSEIAAIIAAGTVRSLLAARRNGGGEERRDAFPEPWELVQDEFERKILRYLQHHGSVEPVRIRRDLNLTSITLYRRLARLRSAGIVRVCGRTRGARYELVPPARNSSAVVTAEQDVKLSTISKPRSSAMRISA